MGARVRPPANLRCRGYVIRPDGRGTHVAAGVAPLPDSAKRALAETGISHFT